MAKKTEKDKFASVLTGRNIPILTLDNKWHQLFTQTNPDKEILKLEETLNELLRKQGKANNDIKEIKRLKKRLMDEIMENADDASHGRDKQAESKQEQNKRLINECNEKIEACEDLLIELPREINSVNQALMKKTMEVCSETLKRNQSEIEETSRWIARIRVELKKRLIRKQEQEQMNQELYAYMHDIFGHEVIDLFDLEYMKQEND
ncbi:MAG: hypothetical protein IKY23_09120 [Lachnospiraceae bacterium]|nr:hypothetical protein [Lachnospiraceae bacterium]